jgi:hypothetical protein
VGCMKKLFITFAITAFFIFNIHEATAQRGVAFNGPCQGMVFSCVLPNSGETSASSENRPTPGSVWCNGVSDLNNLWFCDVFQCGADGKVKMDSGSSPLIPLPPSNEKPDTPSSKPQQKRFTNINWTFGQKFQCVANCCYDNKTHKLLGHYNTEAACQNLCCPTWEGYLARDCSLKTPEETPVETPAPSDDDLVNSLNDKIIF